jgi:ATP-dependent helicase/nuclease subunit A
MMESKDQDLKLTSNQLLAVEAWDQDVLVTAGAGSGKTRTLVARYMTLLRRGVSPRQMAAITFTEKAAREMRNRVRNQVARRAKKSATAEDHMYWQNLVSQMDSARIGTIHSLCAEMIRTHPVEAKVDPDFNVLEEGPSTAIKAQTIQDALVWATGEGETAPLFRIFSTSRLSDLLHFALDHRLDLVPFLSSPDGLDRGWQFGLKEITAFIERKDISQAVSTLDSLDERGDLERDAGLRFAEQVYAFLSIWRSLQDAMIDGELILAAQDLFKMRREHMRMNIGKRDSLAKRELRLIREAYDESLAPWVGGISSSDLPLSDEVESLMQDAFLRIRTLMAYTVGNYRASLEASYSLDFDDLESKALEILRVEDIRQRWRSILQAVLVDEYQDTNARQQDIIQFLCTGRPGSLFVVGDARQSIYRFRGADVTVFRQLQEEIKKSRGKVVELDMTFRAHPELLGCLDELLAPILGTQDLPDILYHVPYSSLSSARKSPREGIAPPYVEILCGVGPSAEEARPVAAQILTQRLIELHAEGQIRRWDEVALLFRASTGFQPYEDALELARIPFVTIAGRGFYDRPEIRDLLNMLRALADPEDDLAMAGCLRSPAFTLSDEALYRLRWSGSERRSMWGALGGDLDGLSDQDRESAERAHQILATLIPLVDRLSVAELIKNLLDLTDYRAIMAAGHSRLWRNVDKLLWDAHSSQLYRVRAFLDYIQTLRDVGIREGEAPAEAEGALQLMTIHRAKGLQFEVVVLADASRSPSGRAQVAYLSPEIGLSVKPDGLETSSLMTKLAQWIDKRESIAEENRLLYVALTRAREKVLISGHLTETRSGVSTGGWLKAILETLEVDFHSGVVRQEQWHQREFPSGAAVAIWIGAGGGEEKTASEEKLEWPESSARPLYQPLYAVSADKADPEEEMDPARDWRATGEHVHAPAAAIGRMVHEVIRRWTSPQDPSTDALLEHLALQEGLIDPGQSGRAIRESRNLLERFWIDPLRERIGQADERYHELPYTLSLPQGGMDIGTIDLLVRYDDRWTIIDFKTDELRDEEELDKAVEGYRPQLMRYKNAVRELLGNECQVILCFLDYEGAVEWVELNHPSKAAPG